MYIYGMVFFLSVACLYFAEHISNKYMSKILILISALIPAILAGIRADDIGTDTLAYRTIYFEPVYELSSLKEVFVWAFKQDFEIGFVLWTYIIAQIFGSFQWFLFFTELFILYFVYKTLFLLKTEIDMYFSLLAYYLFFYQISFNGIRQSMAMVLMVYSLGLVTHKKKYKAYILGFIAVTFHLSAIICVAYFILNALLKIERIKKMRFAIYAIVILVFSNINKIVNLAIQILKLPERSINFYNEDIANHMFNLSTILLKAAPLMILFLLYIGTKQYLNNSLLLEIGMYSLVLSAVASIFYVNAALERLFWYSDIVCFFITVPQLSEKFEGNEKRLIKIGMVMSYLFLWFFSFGIMRYSQTVPYRVFK